MLIAADNFTAYRPSLRRVAMHARGGQAIADLCARAAAVGAHWLDLNSGYVAPRERAELWRFLVATAEAACPLTLMLDAPELESLAQALYFCFCTRRPILNMTTDQPERLVPVLELTAAHGLGLVTATVPADAEGRLTTLAALIVVDKTAKRGIAGERVFAPGEYCAELP